MMRRGAYMFLFVGVVFGLLMAVALLSRVSPAYAQQPVPESQAILPAAVGTAFTYQGRLLGSGGEPVNGVPCRFIFTLWDAETGGNNLGGVDEVVVPRNGYFSVEIDFGQNVFTGDPRWMSVRVRCPEPQGSWEELQGRIPIRPAPYAMFASLAATLQPGAVIDANSTSQGALTGKNGDGVGATLGHPGLFGIGAAGVRAWSNAGYGVWGETSLNNGTTAGVYGQSATEGKTYGVQGVSRSPDGYGVYGMAKKVGNSSGVGVYGEGTETSDGVGVEGHGNYAGVIGVGEGTSGFTFGVYAKTESTNDYSAAVQAESQGTTGRTYGVYASNRSTTDGAAAVYAESLADTGGANAIYAESNSMGGYAIHAVNKDRGTAIYAESQSPQYGFPGNPAIVARATGTGIVAITTAVEHGESALVASDRENLERGVQLAFSNEKAIRVYDSRGEFWSVDWRGNLATRGTFSTPNADMAEMYPAVDGLEPGDVLVIGADGKLHRSDEPYQATVVGVYSTAPGFVAGSNGEDEERRVPLAVVGIVPVKASAENGPIRPGDLLVASSTPGHAMRCEGVEQCFGRVIGKALEGLDEGTGVIQMLVMLQ